MSTVFAEPYARYDRIFDRSIDPNGITIVNSSLPPASIIGSTNPNLFAPATSPVFNANDGITYIYDGTQWVQQSGPQISVVNNGDGTATIGGSLSFPIVPPALPIGNYITTQTPTGIVYTPDIVQAVPIYTSTLNTNVIAHCRGSQINLSSIASLPFVHGQRVPFPLPTSHGYVIAFASGNVIYNPADDYETMSPFQSIVNRCPYTISDNLGSVYSSYIEFEYTKELTDFDGLQNKILKLELTSELTPSIVVTELSKNLAGNDLVQLPLSSQVLSTYQFGAEALAYNRGDNRLYYMAKIAAGPLAQIELRSISYGYNGDPATVSVFVPEDNVQIGKASPPGMIYRANTCAIDQKRHIGFYVHTDSPPSHEILYAAIITLPGYIPQTIPGIALPGTVVKVRDNAVGGITGMEGRLPRGVAWNPVNGKYYSIAMTGGALIAPVAPSTGQVGNAIGLPGPIKLVEGELDYSVYDLSDGANAYVRYVSTVHNLTIPPLLPQPGGTQNGNRADCIFCDVRGILYVFAMLDPVVGSGSYIFTINLNLLPDIAATNASITVINPNSVIDANGDCCVNAMSRYNTLESVDISLAAGGLPTSLAVNQDVHISLSPGIPTPLCPGASIVKPLYGSPLVHYMSIQGETINGTLNLTASPPVGINITTSGTTRRNIQVRGDGTTAQYETILRSLTLTTSNTMEREQEIRVFIVTDDGVHSIIRRIFYITV